MFCLYGGAAWEEIQNLPRSVLHVLVPLSPRQIHADCVLRAGTAKPEGSDSDKLAFTLGAMDMPDPFEKDVPMHGDLEEALKWMAKVCCSEASNPCIQYG